MAKHVDLTGKVYGRLTVVKYLGNSKWLCKCECGNDKIITTSKLNSKHTKSCGCLPHIKPSLNFKDYTGKHFGRLTVLERIENNIRGNTRWLCKCACGNFTVVQGGHLSSGGIQSCGCLNKDRSVEVNTRHGKYRTRLYKVWSGIMSRCFCKNCSSYNSYGGRGITVCDEWRDDFQAFYDWAMKSGYDETAPRGQCTIDRIDVNGNYEPDNCRWVNLKVQANNTRRNKNITYHGMTKNLKEWCDLLGLSYKTIESRIRNGWAPERALTEPIRKT